MKVIHLNNATLETNRQAVPGDTLKINFKGETILLTYGKDGYWRDPEGSIWGFPDSSYSKDSIVRCGIGLLSLPKDSPLNEACRAHDYMYSTKIYQESHTRKEADLLLKTHIELIENNSIKKYLGYPFYLISRIFGSIFWEVKKTNN